MGATEKPNEYEINRTIMEKLLIIADTLNFFSKPNGEDTNIRTVKKNDEFFITQLEKINGEYWIRAAIDESFEGYINEGSKFAVTLPVKLFQNEVTIYQQPSIKSKQIAILNRKVVFYVIHKTLGIDNESKIWEKVRLKTGEIGYMNSDTKVLPINKAKKNRKKKLFVYHSSSLRH